MRTGLDTERRDELLDGLMAIIAENGFTHVRIADIARELKCSIASLYKIAPSKESLVVVAIARWAEAAMGELDECASRDATASNRARCYFRKGAEKLHPLSLGFFTDVARYESTRVLWKTAVVDRYIETFVELVEAAEAAGEVRRVNSRFLAEMLQQIGFATRDERVLKETGLSSEEAVREVDRIIWDGIRATSR